MPRSLYSTRMARRSSRERPMQDRCGATSWPSRWISRTVSCVPDWVDPLVLLVFVFFFGFCCVCLARVARSFSTPSSVLGGKNSMLRMGSVDVDIYFFKISADNAHEITL